MDLGATPVNRFVRVTLPLCAVVSVAVSLRVLCDVLWRYNQRAGTFDRAFDCILLNLQQERQDTTPHVGDQDLTSYSSSYYLLRSGLK